MTRTTRRTTLAAGLSILSATLAFAALPARAQSPAWPEKPITLIIPYSPGGSADLLARPLAAKLQERLGQPIILDYKAGAGGQLASQALVRARPDGYTFIMVLAAHAINVSLYAKLPYDTRKDFAPVSLVANLPMVLAGSGSLRANSVAEIVAYAKANPGKLTFGSAGIGNTGHLAGELFAATTGIKMTHVPYKGSAGVVTAMLSGEIDMTFDTVSTTMPHVQPGKLRALATTGEKRSPLAPDVPTMQEAGVPKFVINGWYAVMAPAGTPQPVIDRMSREIASVSTLPDLKAQLNAQGYELVGSSPAQLATFVDSEIDRWAKVVKAAGARGE